MQPETNKLASRVASRYPDVMAKIIRSVPSGYDWGWFSREDERMYLQTVDRTHFNEHKVWLERDGERVFEPVGAIPTKVRDAIARVVRDRRLSIEAEWCHFAIMNRWMEAHRDGDLVTVTVYPRKSGEIKRTLDLRKGFPEVADTAAVPFLDAEDASLVLHVSPSGRRIDVALPGWLWGTEAI